ncbi:MAG: hypothetical protein ABI137_09190 [Antricoccus sp.]
MSFTGISNIVIIAAVACLVIYRQFATRSADSGMRIYFILAAIGLYETVDYAIKHPSISFAQAFAMLLGLFVAGVIALPRARSMRLWQNDSGQWLRRGNARTFLWWMVALTAHLAIAAGVPAIFGEKSVVTSPFDSASILLYIAVSIGLQAYFLGCRTRSESSRSLTTV